MEALRDITAVTVNEYLFTALRAATVPCGGRSVLAAIPCLRGSANHIGLPNVFLRRPTRDVNGHRRHYCPLPCSLSLSVCQLPRCRHLLTKYR